MGKIKEHYLLQDSPISTPFKQIFSDFFQDLGAIRKMSDEAEIDMNERRSGYKSAGRMEY